MNTYKDLAFKYQNLTDKFSYQGDYNNGHTYAVIYDRLFEPFKNKSINFLEIGLNVGGNIVICSEYFSDIKHYGIDIADYITIDKDLFTFYKGSFDNHEVIKQAGERKYDIILEDGSHYLEHQMKSIDIYLPMLKENGIIIIEDIADVDYLQSLYSKIDYAKYFAYTIDMRFNKNRWDDLLMVIEHRNQNYK